MTTEYYQPLLIQPPCDWRPPSSYPDLSDAKVISIDLETCDPKLTTHGPGTIRKDGFIAGISIATDTGLNCYFPIGHRGGGNLDPEMTLRWLRDQMRGNATATTVGANLLYDLEWLGTQGVAVSGPLFDVQVAEALLDEESQQGYSLGVLAKKYLNSSKDEVTLKEAATTWGVDMKAGLWKLPARYVGKYAEADSLLALQIMAKQKPLLEAENLQAVFDMESRLLPLLLEMRKRGVRVDEEKAERLGKDWGKLESEYLRDIRVHAGQDVDPWSNHDIMRACQRGGIAFPTTEKGNPSFTGDWLETQSEPLLKAIARYRSLNRLRKVYTTDLMAFAVNGRIHCQFHPLRKDDAGTRTGRFSSSCPNLQQIPARDKELAPLIRSLFIPEEGAKWCKHDYSQQEYRILVHYGVGLEMTGADKCAQIFRDDPNADFHQVIADMIGIPRGQAKNINFGICIAEGQRVLTQYGLVPIEEITDCHVLWDGVEWVQHEGLLYKGIKEVITYGGLTATPDHKVWTDEGRKISFREASLQGEALCSSGDGAQEIEVAWDKVKDEENMEGRKIPFGHGILSVLQKAKKIFRGQFARWKHDWMQMYSRYKVLQSLCVRAWQKVRLDDATLLQEYARFQQELQRAWYQSTIQIATRFHILGVEEVSAFGLQKARLRQARQQWALFKKELEARFQKREPAQQTAKVYDILNAGPRRRFTCEGVLVSNCYGMGIAKLAMDLGVSQDEARKILDQHEQNAPFIRELSDKCMRLATQRGWIKTLGGRRQHFNFWEPVNLKDAGMPLRMEQAKVKWPDEPLKRAWTYKALNKLIQGSAADMTKKAMLRAWDERKVVPHLTVHDEVDQSIFSPEDGEYMASVMREALPLCLPVKVDSKVGANWGECK